MRKIAVILAGGEGHRAGGEEPKQFRKIGGHPMYQWSLKAFHEEDPETEILLVCHPGAFDLLDILEGEREQEPADSPWRNPISFKEIVGGRSRYESVLNALMEIEADKDTLVAVHDSARPLVSVEMIRRGWEKAAGNQSAVPVVDLLDSLRRREEDGETVPVNRADYLAVQTPQIFRADILKRAYDASDNPEFTDDASLVQASGVEISLYEGSHKNIKVTVPSDFIIAEALLLAPSTENV